MEKIKNSGYVKEEYSANLLECSCDSSFLRNVRDGYYWSSFSEEQDDLLNETPRISYYNPSLYLNLERRLGNRYSFQGRTSGYSSAQSTVSNESSSPRTATELVKEISTLELEIVNLEQYLLSLYRAAFDYCKNDSDISSEYSRHFSAGIKMPKHTKKMMDNEKYELKSDSSCAETNGSLMSTENGITLKLWHKDYSPAIDIQCDSDSTACHAPGNSPQKDILEVSSDPHYDANQLKNTSMDYASILPCKLSENILKCIAAIYCKLASIHKPQKDKAVVPTSSLTCSSTVHRRSSGGNQSSINQHEASASPTRIRRQRFRDEFYSDLIEIPSISVDGERFGYASKMLSIFRILVKQLKSVNPTKMTTEEQIAFWLNIHNALIMHAFLAYGLHQGRMKNKSSIMKAAYNIGGHSINASVIQSSILGCQLHFSASVLKMQWLEVLLSPALKFVKRKQKHPYALDHPQPLAHFALSHGALSDPPVRVYTAKNILKQLELAKKEFLQANVKVKHKTKIIFPKILFHYMKDCSIEISELMKLVIECMPEAEKGAFGEFLKGNSDECVEWSKYNPMFRYMIHKELARQ